MTFFAVVFFVIGIFYFCHVRKTKSRLIIMLPVSFSVHFCRVAGVILVQDSYIVLLYVYY